MFYLAKFFQAAGLGVVLIGFLKNFPNLMSHRLLGLGMVLFLTGWIVQKFLLKGK